MTMSVTTPPNRSTPVAFWAITALLVIYVAVCSVNWENKVGADAWEHHRAILALLDDLYNPGNPTFATDEPSIRYSPYTIALTLVCRLTNISPYAVLCGAAVVNTVLLAVALLIFLRAYGIGHIAGYALIVMLLLWGEAPGYANTYALADLPWHQLNPSAFSYPLAILAWAAFRRWQFTGARWWMILLLTLASAVMMLSHPMTGVAGFIGMFFSILFAPAERRVRLFIIFATISAATFVLCAIWPWYPFLAALPTRTDQTYWFNPGIMERILFIWCAPALLLVPALLLLRREAVVRFGLTLAMVCVALSLITFVKPSATLGRLPMPAIIGLHVPIALLLARTRVFAPSTWNVRIGSLLGGELPRAPFAAIEIMIVIMIAYCGLPQMFTILREPHLARPYVAAALGREDKQRPIMQLYNRLLAPVQPHDVVMADQVTAWAVPSTAGRIVSALHHELFTPNQHERAADVEAFFTTADTAERIDLLNKYNARWILLDRSIQSQAVFEQLHTPAALVDQIDTFYLLDAEAWKQHKTSTSP